MKFIPLIAAGIGVAATAALVGYFGAGAVMHALLAIGISGIAIVCAIHLVLIAVMGLAWRTLLPGVRWWVPLWGRLMRDSGSEVLPLSQVGGYVLGARALALFGVSASDATATTIVDVTLEFISQVAFTAIGLELLLQLRPDSTVVMPVAIGLGVATLAAVGFLGMQRYAIPIMDRIARALGKGWVERTAASAAALDEALAEAYRHRFRLAGGCFLHLVCWVASAAEAWIVLGLAGSPLPFSAVLVLESLLYATRSAAFLVPNAVGVQEGAYILFGTAFGLSPEMALALSLLKRARDLVIGLPAIGVWQIVEGGRVWRRWGKKRPDDHAPSAHEKRDLAARRVGVD